MGVMSRRVVPVCGSLCFFCPSLRARSRQPVKRYKKLLAEIFPRHQEAELNERKIGKLCEYASKNPLRIPMITDSLEQRFYKDLRQEHFQNVNIVVCIYKKLLSSCEEQMPLFSSSLLAIVQALLDQTRSDDMSILACQTLINFANSQVDTTCMVGLESLISSLCRLGHHMKDGERALSIRSAAMEALASMVHLMGRHAYISMNFESIVSVTLENYLEICDENLSEHHAKSPPYWASVCLRNMAALAKEATTIRRVVDPMLQCFDLNSHWVHVAYPVLSSLQSLLEKPGDYCHTLLCVVAKHLDHKNVVRKPQVQLDIVAVITKLAQNARQQASVAIINTIFELMIHLRKRLQHSYESSGALGENQNTDFQLAVENCILELSNKVGDVGPILDMIAVFLENISASPSIARSTIFSAYRIVQIITPVPNVSYYKKAFPDALLHQLLVAMAHSDQKTRLGAHFVLSTLLMPSLRTYLSEDLKSLPSEDIKSETVENQINQNKANSFVLAVSRGKPLSTLRLSSHQVSLLLSSIWAQATLAANTPENLAAMAQTYNLALMFTTLKSSSYLGLARGFQLAFSIRRFSLDQNGGLRPSNRRSLLTLSSCLLMSCARASNLLETSAMLRESLAEKTIDPFLNFVDEIFLRANETCGIIYGSNEDDVSAWNALSAATSDTDHVKAAVASEFVKVYKDLPNDVLREIKKQLFDGFSPDDVYPLAASFFMESPRASSPTAQLDVHVLDDDILDDAVLSDVESNGRSSNREASVSGNPHDILSVNELLESVLETARRVSSSQASCNPVPYDQMRNQCEALVTGKRHKMSMLQSFKLQNDAKVFPSEDEKADHMIIVDDRAQMLQHEIGVGVLSCGQSSFRLPPSSPYDKFLKAAGC